MTELRCRAKLTPSYTKSVTAWCKIILFNACHTQVFMQSIWTSKKMISCLQSTSTILAEFRKKIKRGSKEIRSGIQTSDHGKPFWHWSLVRVPLLRMSNPCWMFFLNVACMYLYLIQEAFVYNCHISMHSVLKILAECTLNYKVLRVPANCFIITLVHK